MNGYEDLRAEQRRVVDNAMLTIHTWVSGFDGHIHIGSLVSASNHIVAFLQRMYLLVAK